MRVLDLFSGAAGGWSLGLHRAGFRTVAACEAVEWRRALYLQNNPGVRMYDDVRTLTGEQLLRDLGFCPDIVVGSPPCQDISPANTKGKGVEGERSGLYFDAIRIIGEVRPRWFALENSANLRTRGADLVLAALEELGYSCWSFVVRAGDIGANHERPRSWLIGCDVEQVANADGHSLRQPVLPRRSFPQAAFVGNADETADAHGFGWDEGWQGRGRGLDLSVPQNTCHAAQDGCGSRLPRGRAGAVAGAEQPSCRDARDAHKNINPEVGGVFHGTGSNNGGSCEPSHPDQAGIPLGQVEPSLREAAQPVDGCSDGRGREVVDRHGELRPSEFGQVGVCAPDRGDADYRGTDWSLDDLAHHLRVDAGISAWVAQSRIAVGGPRGTAAASLLVEAFGDAVVPQIPEAIGRAILRTEVALSAIYSKRAAA